MFKVNENPTGSILKYKAWLVANEFLQLSSFDFTETFSPLAMLTTIRIVLTVALSKCWYVKQLDMNNAFLNGDF